MTDSYIGFYSKYLLIQSYDRKAGHIDHISPEQLQFTSIANYKYLTPALGGQSFPANFGQAH